MRKLVQFRAGVCAQIYSRQAHRRLLLAAAAIASSTLLPTASGNEAEWIWSPAYTKEQAPQGTCYFRKSFNAGAVQRALVQICCDDSYELYINGRRVGTGQNWKVLDSHDITNYLVQGNNTLAVKAVNSQGSSAGLARVLLKQAGGADVEHSTDASWHTALREFPGWQKPRFDDAQWLAARSFGALGATLPWGNEVALGDSDERFKVASEFHVEWVVDPQETGSLICMTFDEFGQIIASRENGPVIIIRDTDKDGLVDAVSTYCEQLKNCQGLLTINGKLYAVGQGPDGAALYRGTDEDQDGTIDKLEALLKFKGEMGEHGPHALALGPDGLLYILVGNFSQSGVEYAATSPYHHFIEGDLFSPRFEDPNGYAVGIKAPGGSILRTDTEASAVELFAGGLQNPYDMAFNHEGQLFTCDSDMEWDSGMPWYRTTRLVHVSAGAEFGWRSGWSKWPNYYADSLPPALELGRGSPAGMEVYDHHMFPQRYHNALFVCDWSRGRILAIRNKPHGATYKANAEVFLEGQPLNATDLAVGPDGWLYFCTGGRETEGGIYRIVWDGTIPESVRNRGRGLGSILNQPQMNSAWARQRVAQIKQTMGAQWETRLVQTVKEADGTIGPRLRALELLQWFGPQPSASVLVQVSHDRSPLIRAKAARLMGLHLEDATVTRLTELLEDRDPVVQHAACESLAGAERPPAVGKLVKLLASPDRYVSWAAGRALQRANIDEWELAVLECSEPRQFVAGAVALVQQSPTEPVVQAVLDRCQQLMSGYLTDDDFLHLLRVMQVSLAAGKVPAEREQELRNQLSDEYPSRSPMLNRELVRLLVYLQDATLAPRMVEQLSEDTPNVEKMQVLMHAAQLKTGWTTPLKLEVLKAFEEGRTLPGGKSFVGYLENASRQFFGGFTEEEQAVVLAEGAARWPSAALSTLAKLPADPSPEILAQVMKLDHRVRKLDSEAAKKLRTGICAVLGASGDEESMAFLRDMYEAEPDRRVTVAMALAQHPEGDNWAVLVRSLSIVEGDVAQEVLVRLASVDQTSDDPEVHRQVILRGLLLRENGSRRAIELLEKWTGKKHSEPEAKWDEALAGWQAWFAQEYPDMPEPKLPQEPEQSHWTSQELLSYLTTSPGNQGLAARGAALFEKAQCVKCHRYGERGEMVGPDLTNISRRFQKKEILESILFPSQVISDQYATQAIVTHQGKQLSGVIANREDGDIIVLQASGEKLRIRQDDIEDMQRSKVSAMPDSLLNGLSLEEIADLFAYLSSPPRNEVARRPTKLR